MFPDGLICIKGYYQLFTDKNTPDDIASDLSLIVCFDYLNEEKYFYRSLLSGDLKKVFQRVFII
jgi:hypothetical protein